MHPFLSTKPTEASKSQKNDSKLALKSSRNKKDLNDVTAALFSVSFSQLPAVKNTKKGAAVMSLGTFVHSNDFTLLSTNRRTANQLTISNL